MDGTTDTHKIAVSLLRHHCMDPEMRGLNWSSSVHFFLLFSSFIPSLLPDSRVKQKNHFKEVKGQIEIFSSNRQPGVLNWAAGMLG